MRAFLGVLAFICFGQNGFALDAPSPDLIERELYRFETDTVRYMNTPPTRTRVPTNERSPFKTGLRNATIDEVVRAKDETRRALIERAENRIFSEAGEPVDKILSTSELKRTNGVVLRKLEDFETWSLRSKRLPQTAWSGTGWSTQLGGVSQRYASSDFLEFGLSWKDLWDFVNSSGRTFFDIYREGSARRIDLLSPMEKYDLLIGNLSDSKMGYLSIKHWEKGKRVYDRLREVPSWFGICHGWAPASFMYTRPMKTIEVMAADGKTKLKFWPSDLKGLASAMWADGLAKVRFMGKRCNIDDPDRDDNGRVIAPECQDVNPALFHAALVNQLGSAERHLIMDATFDMEVWNQPIVGYSYSYFNPQTKDSAETLAEATVAIQNFKKDKFKLYRSPNTAAVVGVAMNIRYLASRVESHRATDNPKGDRYEDKTYLYDVELDANGKMIGGEWYKNAHPDFLWVPGATTKAVSAFEKEATSQWNGVGSLPADWQAAAKKAATKTQPLAKIVDALLAQASR